MPDGPIEEWSWEELGMAYGASKRTVYRWAEDGAPVREPRQMPIWWERNRRNRCPAGVRLLAARMTDGVAPAKGVPERDTLAPAGETFDLAGETSGSGYAETIAQAEGWRDLCYQQLKAAGAKGSEEGIEKWRGWWEKAANQVRQLKKDAGRIRIDEGEVWDIREARAEVRRVLRQMDSDVKAMMRRVWPELEEAEDEKARERIWRAAWERVKLGWQETRFAEDAREVA